MKNLTDDQLEQDLNLFSNMKEIGVSDFFYTRLKIKMENETRSNYFTAPVSALFVICTLTLFLFINSLLFQNNENIVNIKSSNDIEALATSYDQTISN